MSDTTNELDKQTKLIMTKLIIKIMTVTLYLRMLMKKILEKITNIINSYKSYIPSVCIIGLAISLSHFKYKLLTIFLTLGTVIFDITKFIKQDSQKPNGIVIHNKHENNTEIQKSALSSELDKQNSVSFNTSRIIKTRTNITTY
jgi:hypothetical protein